MHQTPFKYIQYCVINTSGNDLQLMWASSICFSSVFTRTFNMNREMTEHRPSYRHKNDCVKIKIITYRQVLNLFKKKRRNNWNIIELQPAKICMCSKFVACLLTYKHRNVCMSMSVNAFLNIMDLWNDIMHIKIKDIYNDVCLLDDCLSLCLFGARLMHSNTTLNEWGI